MGENAWETKRPRFVLYEEADLRSLLRGNASSTRTKRGRFVSQPLTFVRQWNGLLRHRRVCFCLAHFATFDHPTFQPKYRSSARLVVESPKIPHEVTTCVPLGDTHIPLGDTHCHQGPFIESFGPRSFHLPGNPCRQRESSHIWRENSHKWPKCVHGTEDL